MLNSFGSKYKRCISIVLSIVVLSTTAVAPKRAHAALAIGFGGPSPAGIAVCAAMIGGGLAIGVGGSIAGAQIHSTAPKVIVIVASVLLGLATSLFGLLILDTPNAIDLHYVHLTEDMRSQLGVTPAQAMAFDQDLPEINAIADQITHDLIARKVKALDDATLAFVAGEWQSYGDGLSADSMTVVQKIAAHVAAQVNTRLAAAGQH
jgi:hypothetical protein